MSLSMTMKNYANQGGCYISAEAEDINRPITKMSTKLDGISWGLKANQKQRNKLF